MIQVTKKGFAAKKYTVTALYASTKTDQTQSNNYQDEIHDLQNMIVSLQSQLNDFKNKTQQATTTIITEPSNNTDNSSNNSDSNDSNSTPTANQKKIKDLQDQIASLRDQENTINDVISKTRLEIDKKNPNDDSNDIPSEEKLDKYNTENINSLDDGISYLNKQVENDTQKLKNSPLGSNDYYIANSKLKDDTSNLADLQTVIDKYNDMTKAINSYQNEYGYLKAAQQALDQYNSLNGQLSDLTKQKDSLDDQINSLYAQINTLENQ